MARGFQLFKTSLRFCGSCVLSFAVWTLWLFLVALLAIQGYIASTSELALPKFVRQHLEQRLAEGGIQAQFGHTSFDPTGRILLQDVRLSLPGYNEPIVRIHALYAQLNPWYLVVGRVEPREIRVMGATLSAPAMLSRTGASEEIIRQLDATFLPGEHEVKVSQLSAQVAGIALLAHGVVPISRPTPGQRSALTPELVQRYFPQFCRQVLDAVAKLEPVQSPSLELVFAPSEAGSIALDVIARAQAVELETPRPLKAQQIELQTRVLFLGAKPAITRIATTIDSVQAPDLGATARGVRLVTFGRLPETGWAFEPRVVELSLDQFEAQGVTLDGVTAELFPRPWPLLDTTITAHVQGSPLLLRAQADFAQRSANVRIDGAISPRLLDVLSARTKVNVRRYFDFAALDCYDGEVRIGPGWKFENASARTVLDRINAYGVLMERGRATLTFDGKRVFAPEAFATIGPNFAHGSYEHIFPEHRYRFLLTGQLRPMDISPWFTSWWPNFFQQLEFPVAPPPASVEVSGVWRQGPQTSVFVRAAGTKPIVRGVEFDRLRTRLFIRPGYFEGLELAAHRGEGSVQGSFQFITDLTQGWKSFEVDADTNFDMAFARRVAGPEGESILSPFTLANAPEVRLRGRFEGPASTAKPRYEFTLQAASAGEFRFHNFPLRDASFRAHFRDDEIELDDIRALFGGGSTTGKARVWGTGDARRLSFDLALKDASLGESAWILQEFVAKQKGEAAGPKTKFMQEKAAVRIDLSAAAEGNYMNLLSYRGQGRAALQGAEIGEVPLLGALSEVLKFTSLRFTTATSNFKIEGPKLVFPDLKVTGANSSIEAHGDYLLDKRELDFNAKIFPFHESENILKSVVGVVLTPFSNVFEVKLSGTLVKPDWRLALGPSSLIRSLTGDKDKDEKKSENPTATTPGATPAIPSATPPAPGAAPSAEQPPAPAPANTTGSGAAPKSPPSLL